MKWSRGISGVYIMFNRLKDYLALFVLVAMVLSAIAGLALSEECNGYIPVHALGSGEDDWWTTFPDQHSKAGSSVTHPASVLDTLQQKPVFILVHTRECKDCATQIVNINKALDSYRNDLNYDDILGEGSSFKEATDLLSVYSPLGIARVPTTIFVTLIKGPDGKVVVAWHSVEGLMSEDQIRSYVMDSIYYYQQNAAAWK